MTFLLSDEPNVARRELEGLIFYLATFAAIDGHLDEQEMVFIRDTVHDAIAHKMERSHRRYAPGERQQRTQRFIGFFDQVYARIQGEVMDLLYESVLATEARGSYVRSKLESRCYEVFLHFDAATRGQLFAMVEALISADGLVHPAEVQLHQRLLAFLRMPARAPLEPVSSPRRVVVQELPALPHLPRADEWFQQFEQDYASDEQELARQFAADLQLVQAARQALAALQREGAGRLAGRQRVDELVAQAPFLDGQVFVIPPVASREEGTGEVQLTVLGDLHGCYSCLKAALMQSRFLERLGLHQRDPAHHPEPRLVVLGDYLDRGRYGLSGVLRLLLRLFLLAPRQVFLLRGNHEYLVERGGQIRSGVMPAESIDAILALAPQALMLAYQELFDALPAVVLFGRTLFVHGGIPQDNLLRSRYTDLSSLNHALMRFQMMWSDPSVVDVIPAALQEESVRFSFGRLQCQAFLQRMGCHTLVRGHERVTEGFRCQYEDEQVGLYTLFSAGGEHNDADLPEGAATARCAPWPSPCTSGVGWTGRPSWRPGPLTTRTTTSPS